MEFATEMDEVEEFLWTNKYPVHVENDKGKKANFRRKCRAFVIQDECLKFVHKPNRRDLTEVRFLGVIKDRQYQLDIVLASHRGAGDNDEAVALGGHVGRDKVIDRIMQRYWWRNVTSDVVETIKTCLRCHPQANGLVERNNRTVQNLLLRTLSDRHENWDKCLHGVLFALRWVGLISDTSDTNKY
ncbi:hypothetical protein Pmani_012472 [Petrolisthes manimaculis]|uniref:Integrase zinc-binding domain-containing protein n=1 Tax=Petrolisthes manimaculis TaxID=1843537 RepID=A0AAE1PXV8_9EUCA|nr:hypothetical protein Pmani_012472 [Petrolisthes manimaculis]